MLICGQELQVQQMPLFRDLNFSRDFCFLESWFLLDQDFVICVFLGVLEKYRMDSFDLDFDTGM